MLQLIEFFLPFLLFLLLLGLIIGLLLLRCLDIDLETFTKVVGELHLVTDLLVGPGRLGLLLQVVKEEEALRELNVLVECLSQAVANLLQIKVPKGARDLL